VGRSQHQALSQAGAAQPTAACAPDRLAA